MPITFAEIQKHDNGAQFFAADLHIHTYAVSEDVPDQALTVEAVIEEAVRLGISIISITDHNSSKNTEASVEYGRKYAGQLLVLPGVEVTTAHGHLLVYFARDRTASVQDLLSRISIVGKPGSRNSHTPMSMADTIREAERLGGVCIAGHIDRPGTGFELREDGYPNWKRDVITSAGLYGLEFDDANNLLWYSPEDTTPLKGPERKKLLAARAASPGASARVRLAAVQNSDAHSLAAFTEQASKRVLTKLKMDELTFEGFRTALIDPEARVRPEVTIPPSVPRIRGVGFVGGFLHGETYHFSDNLNCFIGGRGTGKSTAIRGVAYALGADDDFEEHDNCADTTTVYCEDANGILYRYERQRGQAPSVKAREGSTVQEDVAPDAFRIEFYRQGSLAEVAKDPLRNPALLQDFLDKHIELADLQSRETGLLEDLAQNGSVLKPLEAAIAQLPVKQTALNSLNTKLKIAETGKVKEIAARQIQLGAEKNLAKSLGEVKAFYQGGLSFSIAERNFKTLSDSAGQLTGDAETAKHLADAKGVIDRANAFLKKQETTLNQGFKDLAKELDGILGHLQGRHKQLEAALADGIQKLRDQGLSGSITELNTLIKLQSTASAEVSRIRAQEPRVKELREKRRALLEDLEAVRAEMAARRKTQVTAINDNLSRTIRDYTVIVYYNPAGIIDEFAGLVLDVMQGSFFPEESCRKLCAATTPYELATLVRGRKIDSIAKLGDVGNKWAEEVTRRFGLVENFYRLECIAKPPCPVIKVLTRSKPPRQIAVTQLSDGQKHTILLTIAMLAESNMPLVIDQPEDDLDNAFIFTSVVATLRSIKERRQLIVVTHNANIAVLGDSELILPMKRNGDCGTVHERGSIDRSETCAVVQDILEGGSLAFQKRREVYGH